MSAAANDLRYLSEMEARGKVVAKQSFPQPGYTLEPEATP